MMLERSFFSTYLFELTIAILLLVIVNFILIFLIRNSEILKKRRQFKLFLIAFNLLIFSSIGVSYYILKPQKITQRLAFLPTELKSDSFDPNFSFAFVEQIEHNLINQSQDNFIIHSLWWTYKSLPKKYRKNVSIYRELYEKIHSTYILSSQLKRSAKFYEFSIQLSDFKKTYKFEKLESFSQESKQIIDDILGIIKEKQNRPYRSYFNLDYIKAKRLFYQDKLDSLISWSENYPVDDSSILINSVFAEAYTYKGYQKSQYLNTENPYLDDSYKKPFIEAQKRLFFFYNRDQKNIDLYPALIRYFLYQSKFEDVDALIKAYLTDFGQRKTIRKNNPTVLFDYSFLNLDRLRSDGFMNHNDVIKQVIEINPFSVSAYQRLVNLSLKNNTLISDAVKKLFEQLRFFVELNPYNDNAKFLLADTYLKRGEIIKAQQIYKKLFNKYKDKSFIYYNLGITYFRIGRDFTSYQDYIDKNDISNPKESTDKAIYYFEKAKSIDKHLDSHLYLGVIYASRNETNKAVQNFRYRVKHNLGPKDRSYKEAKKGLRKIFEDPDILKKYLEQENRLKEGF